MQLVRRITGCQISTLVLHNADYSMQVKGEFADVDGAGEISLGPICRPKISQSCELEKVQRPVKLRPQLSAIPAS